MSSTPNPTPATVNSDSTSNGKVIAASGSRVMAGNLNLPVNQAVSLPSELKHEILIIPASSQASWNGFHTIDIREQNIILNNITLQFNLGAVVGSSLVGYFNPGWFFFQRIEIVQGGNVIDTIYSNSQFVLNQLLEFDEDRLSNNTACGRYDSSLNRMGLSSQSTTNNYYVNLKTFFDQSKSIHLLSSASNIQLRIYMDSLQNAFYVSSGTLTSCAINACNAICRVTRLDNASAQQRLGDMTLRKNHFIMHDTHYGTFTIPSGVLSSTIILAPIVGNVACLFFTVRASTATNQQWVYTQLASWALLDSAGTNLVGGQVIPASLSANILNRDWCKSSYNTETSFGINDQKSNVYIWSFSADMVQSLSSGVALNSRKFGGQEQLVLNLNSTTTQLQVDVYAYVENVLEVGTNHVKKMSL